MKALLHSAVLGACVAAATLSPAPARGATLDGAAACTPACAMLIEVDGLEPEDVTAEKTPFLWALAHPNEQSARQLYGSILDGRSGFGWQAARAPMTATTATAAASVLTGADTATHAVYADRFREGTEELSIDAPLDAEAAAGEQPLEPPAASTLLAAVDATEDEAGNDLSAAAFVGHPGLDRILSDFEGERRWLPVGSDASSQDPTLCPYPRAPDEESEAVCPASDTTTLDEAARGLTEARAFPTFTYIHLASLGRVKQLYGDLEQTSPGQEDGEPVKRALAELDAALLSFVTQRQQDADDIWDQTFVAVMGGHGYEHTPLDRRVPDLDAPGDVARDLADFVAAATGRRATFVPQGTIGTVYWPGVTTEQLAALVSALRTKGATGCGGGPCFDEIADTHRGEAAPDGVDGSFADRAFHPTWLMDPVIAEQRTGAGGELVLTATTGWAFGQAFADGTRPQTDAGRYATNPNPASAGGPRSRAIAALMSGPAQGRANQLVQVQGDWLRVKAGAEDVARCGNTGAGVAFAVANDPATLGDDAGAPGHECQAETVDFPLTFAALLRVDLGVAQISPRARFLDEAFAGKLGLPVDAPEIEEPVEQEPEPEEVVQEEEEEEAPPPRVVAPPPPEVLPAQTIVVETRAPSTRAARTSPDPFAFRGVLRRLRARVTDADGRVASRAPKGARLSSLEIRAELGRASAQVRVTLYRRARRDAGRRARLAAISTFEPFRLTRGPARLTLKVPRLLRPTHVGLSVVAGARRAGGIVPLGDARRLHARAGARAR